MMTRHATFSICRIIWTLSHLLVMQKFHLGLYIINSIFLKLFRLVKYCISWDVISFSINHTAIYHKVPPVREWSGVLHMVWRMAPHEKHVYLFKAKKAWWKVAWRAPVSRKIVVAIQEQLHKTSCGGNKIVKWLHSVLWKGHLR
jgi:hypothetical protein